MLVCTCIVTLLSSEFLFVSRSFKNKERAKWTCILGQGPPVTLPVGLDVVQEDGVLLRRPPPSLQPHLLAARSSPHPRSLPHQLTHSDADSLY